MQAVCSLFFPAVKVGKQLCREGWGEGKGWLKDTGNVMPWTAFQNRETTPVQSEPDSILPGDMWLRRLLLQASLKPHCQGVITSNLGLFTQSWPLCVVILTECHGSNRKGLGARGEAVGLEKYRLVKNFRNDLQGHQAHLRSLRLLETRQGGYSSGVQIAAHWSF